MTSIELEKILTGSPKDSLLRLMMSCFAHVYFPQYSKIKPEKIDFDFLDDYEIKIEFHIENNTFTYVLTKDKHMNSDKPWIINSEEEISDVLVRSICLVLVNRLLVHIKTDVNVVSSMANITTSRVDYKYGHCYPSEETYKMFDKELKDCMLKEGDTNENM